MRLTYKKVKQTAWHFILYSSVPKSWDEFRTEPFSVMFHQWLPCEWLAKGGSTSDSDELGDWSSDSANNSDIRMRWVMAWLSKYYSDVRYSPSDRMLMNDVYNWIKDENARIESFADNVYRACFVHRLLNNTAGDSPTDVLRKEDIVAELEYMFEWLAGNFAPTTTPISC